MAQYLAQVMNAASLIGLHPALEAALFALFIWWFATGFILLLDGLPKTTFRWSIALSTLVSALAFAGLAATARDTSVAGAYGSFTCALLIWGWLELSFLTGWLTGPRRTAAAPDAQGWVRFREAVAAIAYHELAILASVIVVALLCADQPNQAGLWTYLVLWIMRTSAKLNLFYGVRNLGEAFLPPHLTYMASFFRKRPMNLLFPVSVTLPTAVVTIMVMRAFDGALPAGQVIGLLLASAMLTLAIVEHWMLVLPLPTTAPWHWAMRRHRTNAQDHPASPPTAECREWPAPPKASL